MLDPRKLSAVKVLVFGLGLGLLSTAASCLVSIDYHPTADSFMGDARVFGYPKPFAYTLISDRNPEEMAMQIACTIDLSCGDYPRPRNPSDPLVAPPFF